MAQYRENDKYDQRAEKDVRDAWYAACKKMKCEFIADGIWTEIEWHCDPSDGDEISFVVDGLVYQINNVFGRIGGLTSNVFDGRKFVRQLTTEVCKKLGLKVNDRKYISF